MHAYCDIDAKKGQNVTTARSGFDVSRFTVKFINHLLNKTPNMRIIRFALPAGTVFLFLIILSIGCQKTGTNPVTVIKDSTVVKDSTVYVDSAYADSVLTSAALKNGLLVYLPFDGNFADSSGNGNPTTPLGGAALGPDEHGYGNKAFVGNGDSARIAVSNNGSIQFDTAYSISADVMVLNGQSQAFTTMEERSTGEGVSFGFGMGIPGISNLEVVFTDSLASCSDFVSASNSISDTSQIILSPFSWYNVVSTFYKGTSQIFVNGTLVSTKTGGGTTVPLCPSADFVVGGWWDGQPEGINGTLDEVRLYNRVLTANEINFLARNFQPGSTRVKPAIRSGKTGSIN